MHVALICAVTADAMVCCRAIAQAQPDHKALELEVYAMAYIA